MNDRDNKKANNCNCQKGVTQCPLKGNCREETVVYKAEVKVGQNTKNYIGMTEGEFKKRYYAHKHSFKNNKKQEETALSQLVWENKLNPEPQISWSILKRAHKMQNGGDRCDLCLTEKLCILKAVDDSQNINRKVEATSLCVHRNKYKLANLKT